MSLPEVEVVPAILVKTKEEFLERLKCVSPYVSHVQWDIMDGEFVKNITFSDPSVLEIYDDKRKNLPLIEVDLMVSTPRDWVERLHHSGVDRLIFHIESLPLDFDPLFEQARGLGFSLGIASDPETPINLAMEILPKVDRFQAMGGRSGFGGQRFNPVVLENVRKVRAAFPHVKISVDIGVNAKTAPQIVSAGADILVSGSAIYDAEDVAKEIESLRKHAEV